MRPETQKLFEEHMLLNHTWNTTDGGLTSRDLANIYEAIQMRPGSAAAIGLTVGFTAPSDRRLDRGLQILKRKGLIYFSAARQWEVRHAR